MDPWCETYSRFDHNQYFIDFIDMISIYQRCFYAYRGNGGKPLHNFCNLTFKGKHSQSFSLIKTFNSQSMTWNGMLRHSIGGEVFFSLQHIRASFLKLMLCLSVDHVLYCFHCLPPTSQGQAGNKEQDRQTNRALISFWEFFGGKALANKL